jgi:mRNA interferase RelE/StbE
MRRLDAQNRERIITKIEQYAINPASLARQVIMLTGRQYRRLRVGSYRVIFNIENDRTMIVLRVGHGREAYD